MTSGDFSSSLGSEALTPASAVRGPEQHPPATEADCKARRRPARPDENPEDALTPPDDWPAHEIDDLA